MNIIKKIGIRKFVKEIDKDIKVKFQKWDMECDIFEETVYIGNTYNIRTDKLYMEYVKELAPDCNVPVFLLSILHEIGHIMTYEEEDMDEKDMVYGLLKATLDDNPSEELEDMCVKAYFRIPLEEKATLWGIDFAMTHPELIQKYMWLCK